MLNADLVAEFVELGEELFTEFVGEDSNASYVTRIVLDPVLGTLTEVSIPCRAIPIQEEVPGGKGEKLYENAIYLLQSEIATLMKDAEIRITGGKTYAVRAWSADPAEVTWRAAVNG